MDVFFCHNKGECSNVYKCYSYVTGEEIKQYDRQKKHFENRPISAIRHTKLNYICLVVI